MISPQKLILAVALFSFIISCGNIDGEQQKSTQENSTIPSSKDTKSELPITKPEVPKPVETPIRGEGENNRLKKFDTLKPIVVIP